MARILKISLRIEQQTTDKSALWSVNPRCPKDWEPHPRKQDHVQSCTLGALAPAPWTTGPGKKSNPYLSTCPWLSVYKGKGAGNSFVFHEAWPQQYNYFIDIYKRDKGVWARYSHVCLQVSVIIMTHFCSHILHFQFIWSLWSCPWSTCKQTLWSTPVPN